MFSKVLKSLILTLSLLVSYTASAREKVELTEKNTVVLRGEVNAKSIANVTQKLMANTSDRIYLFVSSPGGSILDGLHLVTYLQTTDKKITCVSNMAASMAFIIMQACPERLVTDDAILMQHVATYGVEGPAPNNHTMVKFIERMIDKMAAMQADRLNMSVKEFKDTTRDDWWLFGDESVESYAADDVATVTCSKKLIEGTTSELKTVFIFSFNVVWSNCPMVEGPLRIEQPKNPFDNAKPVPAPQKQDESVNTNGNQELAKEYRQLLNDLDWRAKLMQRFHGGTTVKMPGVY